MKVASVKTRRSLREIPRARPLPPTAMPTLATPNFESLIEGTGSELSPRVERVWPDKDGQLRVEWTVSGPDNRRFSIFGVPLAAKYRDEQSCGRMTRHGISGLRVAMPDWEMLLHVADTDPKLPHLKDCLDDETMCRTFQTLGLVSPAKTYEESGLQFRVLAHKPGRRAVIAYEGVYDKFGGDEKCGTSAPGCPGLAVEGGSRFDRSAGRGRRNSCAITSSGKGQPGADVPHARRQPRADVPHFRLVGKTYRDDRALRIAEWMRQVSQQLADSGNAVRLPKVLGVDSTLKLILIEWCDGQPGEDRPVAPGPRLKRVAGILAKLHAVQLDGLPAFSVADELAISLRWGQFLRRLNVRLADRCASLCERLARWSERLESGNNRTIHRDFYEKQLIWSRRGPVLLDLDTLALGDPALDVGNFLGHMLLNRAQHGASIDNLHALARTFVAHYHGAGGKADREAIAFYWASSLIRGGAIHSLRDATRTHVPAMWALGDRLIRGEVRV